MIFHLTEAASVTAVVKDIMMVLGGCVAVIAAVYGVWSAIRNRREAKQKQTHKSNLELSGKFAHIDARLQQLQTSAEATEHQHTKFQQHMGEDLKMLAQQTDDLRAQCIRHQQTVDLDELKREIEKLADRFDQLHRDFANHREQVSERYLTIGNYQSDLSLLTSNFDALRQSIRDLTMMLGRRVK